MNYIRIISSALTFILILAENSTAQVDLSPAGWGEEELKNYVRSKRIVEPITKAESVMITGTSSSIAIRAGLEALKQGGSAIDAALTTALTHISLAGGCTVSYAGVLTLVYFDSSTNEITTLDGGYNTVKGETDPLTIPRSSRSDPSQQGVKPIPKGRTVLVPGFMAGLDAAHKRFGKLPFAEIFKPAIYFAEEGFPISAPLSRLCESNKDVIFRTPETVAIFTKKNGAFYAPGETFKQPALASTLRLLSKEGVDYFYSGAWARKFVTAVQRDGGRLTMKDMESYKPTWNEPIHVTYRGNDLYLPYGGINIAGMLNLLEVSDLASKGRYTESPETFFWLYRIIEAVNFNKGLGNLFINRKDWAKREFAKNAWEILQLNQTDGAKKEAGKSDDSYHSDAIVVIDKAGNMAALLHSSNTSSFSETGLYIDGVSIPDSATFQQATIVNTRPGGRLYNPTAPLIVLKDGKPVLGVSAIGSGIHEETLKCLFNILGFDLSPQAAIDAPSFVPFFGNKVDSPSIGVAISEGAFSDELIGNVKKKGLQINILPAKQARRRKGAVAAVYVNLETGFRQAGSVRKFSLGY